MPHLILWLALSLGTPTPVIAQDTTWIIPTSSYPGEPVVTATLQVKDIQFTSMCRKVVPACEKDCALHDCNVSVNPRADFVRSLTFNDDATFSSFIAVPGEKLSQTTGMRAFSLYPKKNAQPRLGRQPNGDIVIELVSGHQVVFSGTTGELISNTIGELDLSAPIDLHHNGSFEVKKLKDPSVVLIDHGWRRGESPRVHKGNRKSKVIDSLGHICEIKNSEIFYEDRTQPGNPETGYRFEGKDSEFAAWLKTRCPSIVWGLNPSESTTAQPRIHQGPQAKKPGTSSSGSKIQSAPLK